MAVALPELDHSRFAERLRRAAPPLWRGGLPGHAEERLHAHYLELARWSPRLALIGAGTAERAVELHYGESLAAAALLPESATSVADIGSGAGFPGLVVAALRPELETTLVEPRERKWSFLKSAARRMSLPCRCLNARVGRTLPGGFPERIDAVTVRALRLSKEEIEALSTRMRPRACLITWSGSQEPRPPRGFALGARLDLGSDRGSVVRYEWSAG